MINKELIEKELQDFIKIQQLYLMDNLNIAKDRKKQLYMEIAMAKVTQIILNGIEG